MYNQLAHNFLGHVAALIYVCKKRSKEEKKLTKLMQKYLLVLKIVFESGLRRIMKFMRSAIVLHSRLEVLFRYNAELQGYVSRIGYRLTCKPSKF